MDDNDRTEAGARAAAGLAGMRGSSALNARLPAETMRQADASRSPLSRPSIDLPPTDYNAPVEHTFPRVQSDFGSLRLRP